MHVLHRSGKEGLGKAYLAGISWGIANGFELFVQMDADGSHRAVDLPKLLAAAPWHELVIGSRWTKGGKVENWPWHRMMLSRWGNVYAQFMLASSTRDMTAGFRVYKASLLQRLDLENLSARGYSFQVEMTRKSEQANATIIEVPAIRLSTALEHASEGSSFTLSDQAGLTLHGLCPECQRGAAP
jgi:dolichol-phosphate mannosyltransferase